MLAADCPKINLGDLYNVFVASDKFVRPHVADFDNMLKKMQSHAAEAAKETMRKKLDNHLVALVEAACKGNADAADRESSAFIVASKSSSGLYFTEKEQTSGADELDEDSE